MKSKKSTYKYNRKSGCWNCGIHGHVSKKCRRPKVIRCSFCLKLGVKSMDCNCRNLALQGIPTKSTQECLRVQHGKLVLDVKILTNIFSATINSMSLHSTISQAIANYLMLCGIQEGNDKTFSIDVYSCNKFWPIQFYINNDMDSPITLGINAFLLMGFQFHTPDPNLKEVEQKADLTVCIENEYFKPDEEIEDDTSEDELNDILEINWNDSL